jgi:hypothetical protein
MFSIIKGEMGGHVGLLGDVELCYWGKRHDCLYGTIIVPAFCVGVKLGL